MPHALATALSTALLLLASAPTPREAVASALALAGAEVEVSEVRLSQGAGCSAATWETLKPVESSGPAGLRFDGTDAHGSPCQGYAWARVRVLAPAAVTTRALREGEPLDDAVALASREVLPGHHALGGVPAGAVAGRALPAGTALEPSSIRVGPRLGGPVTVVLQLGSLSVEQPGRAVPCARDRACALLPSGRRVEGRLVAGRLLVEAP
jgi:hypothetical protein